MNYTLVATTEATLGSTSGEGLINISNLSFSYLGDSRPVLNKTNLTIREGEIVVLAGHSGSGKSTLLRAINGLIPHQHGGEYSGEVVVDGMVVASSKMSQLTTKVGYIFQNPENQIFMFSVERDIAFGLENQGLSTEEIRNRVNWAMDLLQINHLALRAPHELSDGQKQRVAIAGVLAMKPKVLILDEPTSLLDPYTARSLVDLVKDLRSKLGMTVLIVEHRLDLVAKICDRIIVIDQGKIVIAGPPRDVLSRMDIGLFGVTEPTIVKLAKLALPSQTALPLDADEFRNATLKQNLNPS